MVYADLLDIVLEGAPRLRQKAHQVKHGDARPLSPEARAEYEAWRDAQKR
ncbi:MAG TPA: hypothetical protein VFW96_03615 [Thermomicrobiales bacterium]|nr:hypothetical protein [Thermomicrobiales bacterium]